VVTVFDIRRAVRPDQALHGARRIRAEFLFAVLLLAALAVLAAVRLLDRHRVQGRGWCSPRCCWCASWAEP
jgi:hypothetical protein